MNVGLLAIHASIAVLSRNRAEQSLFLSGWVISPVHLYGRRVWSQNLFNFEASFWVMIMTGFGIIFSLIYSHKVFHKYHTERPGYHIRSESDPVQCKAYTQRIMKI